MKCPSCEHEYESKAGDNQHSACPRCNKPVGTKGERAVADQHAEALHRFKEFWDATPTQRKNARKRRNMYDGRHWTAEEARKVEARGQAPVVFNYFGKKIDHLDGIEIETRTDPKPRPRTPMHQDDVQAAEDAIRFACDAAKVDKVFSKGWDEKLVEGVCGAIIEHEVVGQGDSRDIKLPVRYVHWDRCYYDPHSRETDFSDAKYKGCFTWMDVEDAKAFYKARTDKAANCAEMIDEALAMPSPGGETASETADDKPFSWSDPKRKRVLIVEEYYQAVDEKGVICWYTRHFTGAGFIVPPKKTGYHDEDGVDVCPLELDSGIVDGDGDTHERYGLSERMVWPSLEINKRRSKYLHAANTRQVTAEEGAILDPEKFKAEAAKPDGLKIVRKGALSNNEIKEEMAADIGQANANLLGEAKDAINQIGPDLPMIATAAASSGRERQIMQNVGMTELARQRDQQRNWKLRVITQLWWRIKQFWTYEMWRRVQDDTEETGYRFVGLNRRTTKGARVKELMGAGEAPATALRVVGAPPELLANAMQQVAAMLKQDPAAVQQLQANPEQGQKVVENMAMRLVLADASMQEAFTSADVAKLGMDIILDEVPDVTTVQQEEAEAINKVGEQMIAAGQKFPIELSIEMSGLRSSTKKRLIAILEKAQQGPDPAVVQLQQKLAQLEAALKEAQVIKTVSEAELNKARTAATEADVPLKQAQAMNAAADAGHKVAGGGAPAPAGLR
jgi:hypothetical protein